MKKKIVLVLLSAACAFSIAACGSSSDDSTDTGTTEENTTEESTDDADKYEYGVEIYSDDYVTIAVDYFSTTEAIFTVTNNTEDIIHVDCSYIQLDGVEYAYGDEWASDFMEIAGNGTRQYTYVEAGWESSFEISNPDCETISGVFGIWDADGVLIEYANISDVSLK